MLIGQLDHFLPIKHQGLARRQTEASSSGFDHGLNRGDSNYRNVEAHVLIRLGYLNHSEPAAHLHMFDLTGHDRFLDTFVFEETKHLAELTNAYPGHAVSDAFDLRIRFFADSRDCNLRPGFVRAFEHEKGKLAVACD